MKIGRIAAGVLVVCSGWTAFAAYQFDYGNISAANADYGNPVFGGFADRGGRIGLQNAFYFNTGSYLYVTADKGNPSFGAYYLDGLSKGSAISLARIADGQYTAVDANGKAIRFNSGDSIGFWIKDSQGRIVYDTPGIDGQHTYNGTAIVNGNDYVVAFGEYGDYIKSPTASFTFDEMVNSAYAVFSVQIGSTVPPGPSGQPLPGVLAALLAGGGVYAGWRRRLGGR